MKPKAIPHTRFPLADIHQKISERMGPGIALCMNCGAEKQLSVDQVKTFMSSAWPVCCNGTLLGGTMHFYHPDQIAAAREQVAARQLATKERNHR